MKVEISPFILFLDADEALSTELKDFIILRGFMDGFFGYIVSVNSAYEVFLKYEKLRSLYREEKEAQK